MAVAGRREKNPDPRTQGSPWFAYVVMALCGIVWGSKYFVVRGMVSARDFPVSPEMAGLVGHALCAVLLLLARKSPLPPQTRGTWRDASTLKQMLLIGLLGGSLNMMTFFGLKFTTAANGAILQRTDILFTLLISQFFLKERIRRKDWWSIAVMVIGVAAVMRLSPHALHARLLGDSMILAAAFLLSLNAVFIQRCLKVADGASIALVNAICIAGLFLTQALCSATPLSAQFAAATHHIGSLLLLGTLLGMSLVLYYLGLEWLPLWEVRIFMLLIPVSSAVLEAVFLGTPVTLGQALGIAAVMAGAATISLRARRPKPIADALSESELTVS